MNNIITLKRLSELLAASASCDITMANNFVIALTETVTEALVDGDTVKIKGVGSFSVADDNKVVFVPDNELSQIINEPFEMFSPEELAPEVTDEDLAVNIQEKHETEQTQPAVEQHQDDAPAQPEIAPHDESTGSIIDDEPENASTPNQVDEEPEQAPSLNQLDDEPEQVVSALNQIDDEPKQQPQTEPNIIAHPPVFKGINFTKANIDKNIIDTKSPYNESENSAIPTPPSYGSGYVDQEIDDPNDAQNEIDNTLTDINAAREEIDKTDNEIDGITTEIDNTIAEIKRTQEAVNATAAAIDEAQAQAANASAAPNDIMEETANASSAPNDANQETANASAAPNDAKPEAGKANAESKTVKEEERENRQPKNYGGGKLVPMRRFDLAEEDNKNKPNAFWMTWAAIFGVIIGLAIGFFAHDPIERILEPSLADEYEYGENSLLGDEVNAVDQIDDTINELDQAEENAEAAETSEASTGDNSATTEPTPAEAATAQTEQKTTEAQPAPSTPKAQDKPQGNDNYTYDTVQDGHSLGYIARKHYGANIYWVYIYLENKSVISNPNRVESGTKLRIPPLSKYATLPTDAENKEAAQKKANEILRQYPR